VGALVVARLLPRFTHYAAADGTEAKEPAATTLDVAEETEIKGV
jgi:hypothetical protein